MEGGQGRYTHWQIILIGMTRDSLDHGHVFIDNVQLQRDGIADHKVAHVGLLLLRQELSKLAHVLDRCDDLVAREGNLGELFKRLVLIRNQDKLLISTL